MKLHIPTCDKCEQPNQLYRECNYCQKCRAEFMAASAAKQRERQQQDTAFRNEMQRRPA